MVSSSPTEQALLQRFFPGGVGRLRCPVQRYPWGLPAAVSLVGRLAGIKEGTEPCAELWMGAHPRASAELLADDGALPLYAAVASAPNAVLGHAVALRWGGGLPFLFKVLSIGAPLSIQAHPDSACAVELHRRDPMNYPDPYHKPEIGVALSPVEMLAGFLSGSALNERLTEYPELATLVGNDRGGTEAVYRSIVEASDERHGRAVKELTVRLQAKGESCSLAERYFLRMHGEYGPHDRGLFGFFVFNLITLCPGEGVFLGPNFPHAYLKGELIECMANSDNVVRAGLTRKFQDRATLLGMLDYQVGAPRILNAADHIVEPGRIRFTSAAEFTLERYTTTHGTIDFPDACSLALILVLHGEAHIRTERGARHLVGGDVGAVPAVAGRWSLEARNADIFIATVPR